MEFNTTCVVITQRLIILFDSSDSVYRLDCHIMLNFVLNKLPDPSKTQMRKGSDKTINSFWQNSNKWCLTSNLENDCIANVRQDLLERKIDYAVNTCSAPVSFI